MKQTSYQLFKNKSSSEISSFLIGAIPLPTVPFSVDFNTYYDNWSGVKFRSSAFIKALISALVELRNKNKIQLTAKVIEQHLTINKTYELLSNPDLSYHAKGMLLDFLKMIGSEESDYLKVSDRHGKSSCLFQYTLNEIIINDYEYSIAFEQNLEAIAA